MTPPVSTPRPDKRRALLDGALAVFARDGYTRASIDTIAQEAGVSTRTIYNHFGDKATLFRAVIVDSAERTAERQIGAARWLLGKITDLEKDLIGFGMAWATPDAESAQHFALVRQIAADAGHLPAEAIDAWQQAGPLRVQTEIAAHLRSIANAGLLIIDDEMLAANQLVQLTAGSVHPLPVQTDITVKDVELIVHSGVRVFLAAYQRQRPLGDPPT
ncbi:MAG: TetR/AcrR family transcriptional regulator [Candidatus Saccharibacteria bacterium]|nr:TetR/AcrR family transcriptional regulator [Microbacteriaceae bacterium]